MGDEVMRLHRRVEEMRARFAERDHEMELIYAVRQGDLTSLAPEHFSEDLPREVVANFVDVAARDLADVMSPLPALDCAVGNGVTNTDKQKAEKKNRIGTYYWTKSKLQRQMRRFADSYNSYGVGIFEVEADFDQRCPMIRVEDARGCYYRKDRWGNVVEYAKVWQAYAGDLAAMYPEYRTQILTNSRGRQRQDNELVQMVKYRDKDRTVIYLPECSHTVLASAPNPVGRLPVVIAERDGLDVVPRGQFSDVIWVQLAKAIMAQYVMSAADKAINAPIFVPKDVSTFNIGSDGVISSDGVNPGHGRLRLDVPREVFALNDELDEGLKEGARYPDARVGGVKGSIITGRGIEAMLGTFDTQLKSAQELFKIALEEVTSLCFEMDVALWPNLPKKISGLQTGKPYTMTYVPQRDIGDSYTCEATYGFAAGMTPAQAMVAILQLRGDDLIGRDTARNQMPFDIDPEKEQRDIEIGRLNDSLLQGLAASAQAIAPMIQQGMPVDQLLLSVAKVIEDREKGRPLHISVQEAFKPPEPSPEDLNEPAPDSGMEPEAGMEGPGGPGGLPGVGPQGRLQGVAAGQAGSPPGGLPAIQSLIAGLRGGEPRMSAETLRKKPLGIG